MPTSLDPRPQDQLRLEPLVLDLVEWVARAPRAYADVIDAWRSSCPRLTVWEEACERGLLTRRFVRGEGASVHVTPAGARFLDEQGRRVHVRRPGEMPIPPETIEE